MKTKDLPMAMRQDYSDVVAVLEGYFDALYHADSNKLAKVFHHEARYVCMVEGDYMNYSIPEYFAFIDRRVPPASTGDERADEIVSIEFGGSRMAVAKVTMTLMERDYLDFLTLTKDHDGWRIMSKVFFYVPKSTG